MKFVFVTKYYEGFKKANTRVEMTTIHASDNGTHTLCTELQVNMKEIL